MLIKVQRNPSLNPVATTAYIPHSLSWFNYTLFGLPKYDENVLSAGSCSLPTIYCIHGTVDRPSGFLKLANRIKKFCPNYKIELIDLKGSLFGDNIETYVEQVITHIKLKKEEQIILMGHSRGALIAAQVALKLIADKTIQVMQLHCIAGPFKGTNKAKIFPCNGLLGNPSLAQMCPDSTFLIKLSKDLLCVIKEQNLQAYFYAASADEIVPWFNSYPGTAEDVDVFLYEEHGHISIMTSNNLAQILAEHIIKDKEPRSAQNKKLSFDLKK